jgi:hypothetical protein
VQCHDDSNAVISIKIEQEEPIDISFSSIKDEPDVSESTDISIMCRIAVSLPKLPFAVAFGCRQCWVLWHAWNCHNSK